MSNMYIDDKGKYFTQVISKDAVRSVIQTLSHRIEGTIYVRQGERVKDELDRAGEMFLAVTYAIIYTLKGEVLLKQEFLAINRQHIIWLAPKEETSAMGAGSSQP